jgi:hypothetical protein
MSQTLYFLVFIGLLAICFIAMAAWRPPQRRCPACGRETAVQARRCRHCEYMFAAV